MKKIIKLKLGVSLLTITFSMLGGINQVIAQTCTTPPSCNTLGYKQSVSECTGQQMLKCPFDNSKVFCGGTDCDSSFTISSCDTTKGTCTSCGGKYKYKSCNSGWTLSNGNCVENSCSGYSTSRSPNCTSFSTCISGTITKYSCNSCNSNCYYPDGSGCSAKPGFTSKTIPANSTGYETCTNNGTTYYKATGCKTGYNLVCDGGACWEPYAHGTCDEAMDIW